MCSKCTNTEKTRKWYSVAQIAAVLILTFSVLLVYGRLHLWLGCTDNLITFYIWLYLLLVRAQFEISIRLHFWLGCTANAITFIPLYLLFVRAVNVFEIIQLYLCLCVRLMWDIYPTLLLTWLYGCCKHIYPAVLVISACGQCTYIHPDLLVPSAVIRILGCTSLQETGSFPVQSKMNDRTITRTTSGWLLA